jgi:phytoene desaturase
MADASGSDATVTVVGAGFGGLSTAAYLADAGVDVQVLERHDRPGGHAGVLERDGFRFDTGPSWYLMPDVFERFFAHFDREPGDYYALERLDPQYRVFWKDGDDVTIRPNRENVHEVFDAYEDGAGDALERYLDRAERNYELAMNRVIYPGRERFRDYVDTDLLPLAPRLRLFGTVDDYVSRYVTHPKLKQLLEYTLVFLGGSPYDAPALYTVMSHVDLNGNVFYPEGGIAGVVDALVDLCTDLGVDLRTGVDVTDVRGSAGDFRLATSDGVVRSDVVVSNANPAVVERELLDDAVVDRDPDYWDDRTYAPSALMLYLGVEGDLDELAHHSLVLPTDWEPHFDAMFEEPRWPEDPAYYLSVASKSDDGVAPDGHHAVVVLVPIAPGLDDDPAARDRLRDAVLADLEETVGVDLRDRIVVEESACVSEFAARYGNPQGTALGLAHTLRQTGPLRPGHRGPVDGLYYTGSYTAPGIGMPMCLISGEHAADVVLDDHPALADAPPTPAD